VSTVTAARRAISPSLAATRSAVSRSLLDGGSAKTRSRLRCCARGVAVGQGELLDRRRRQKQFDKPPRWAFCVWQVGLAHFGGLFWPTPGTLKVKRIEFRSAGA